MKTREAAIGGATFAGLAGALFIGLNYFRTSESVSERSSIDRHSATSPPNAVGSSEQHSLQPELSAFALELETLPETRAVGSFSDQPTEQAVLEVSSIEQMIDRNLGALTSAVYSAHEHYQTEVNPELQCRLMNLKIFLPRSVGELQADKFSLATLPGIGVEFQGYVSGIGLHTGPVYGELQMLGLKTDIVGEETGLVVLSPTALADGFYRFKGFFMPHDQDRYSIYLVSATK